MPLDRSNSPTYEISQGKTQLLVRNANLEDLLKDVLIELKLLNTILQETYDTPVNIVPAKGGYSFNITGILLNSSIGKFINGKTSDDDVLVTILGYYVKENGE